MMDMKTIEAKVKVNADRTVTVQLPVDVQAGEYDAVLVLSSSSDVSLVVDASLVESEPEDEKLAVRWQKWFEQVEQLSLLENSEKGDFQQHLVEKYRKQGLVL
jgi:exosome complex RNA-binding protein Rrp42 (RNase PH superfamily)